MSKKAGKKAQMSYVVGIILILLAFFIIWGIAGKVLEIMGQSGKDAACTASAQISSKTKIAGIETISLNCPLNLIEITNEDLSAGINKARKDLAKIYEHNKENPTKQIQLNYFQNSQDDTTKLKEYALDEKIGEEMRKCWYKLGEGKLDLFNSWYGFQDKKPWRDLIPGIGENKIPITCVVCSRIKFDDKIKEIYPSVSSINEWLKISTVPKRDVTYYDYLLDELHDQYLFTMDWSFETDEPLAVVFARMNPQYIMTVAGNFLQFYDIAKAPEAVDALYLIPYSEAGQYCNYLANKAPEED